MGSQVEVISNEARAMEVFGVCEAVMEASRDYEMRYWVCATFVHGYVYSPEVI